MVFFTGGLGGVVNKSDGYAGAAGQQAVVRQRLALFAPHSTAVHCSPSEAKSWRPGE